MGAIRADLLPTELESLMQLSRGSVHKRIPEGHGDKLVRCGFAAFKGGVLIITTRGYAKLAFEVTRSSWFATPV